MPQGKRSYSTTGKVTEWQLRDRDVWETGRRGNRKLTWDGELLASSLGGLSSGGAELFWAWLCFLREWTHTCNTQESLVSFLQDLNCKLNTSTTGTLLYPSNYLLRWHSISIGTNAATLEASTRSDCSSDVSVANWFDQTLHITSKDRANNFAIYALRAWKYSISRYHTQANIEST